MRLVKIEDILSIIAWKMKSYILIETSKKNKYLFDKKRKKAILCHPLFYFILTLVERGIDPGQWLKQFTGDQVEVNEEGKFPKKEVIYYYNKYQILKENGYFSDYHQENFLSGRLTPEMIESALANTRLITYEVTDKCGMNCAYCGYGQFYANYDERQNKTMDITMAKQLLKYIEHLLNSSLNRSHDREISIGLYGGEPLLYFPFIEKMVSYVSELKLKHNRFNFVITTNGLLVEKYMDFLAEHQFNLLISLDGSEKNNEYRVFKNGKPAFGTIMKNIDALIAKHPEYFKKRVNFNAVLHNKNSVSEVFNFFKTYFNKIPSISSLNTNGIADDKKKDFEKTYLNVNKSLYASEEYPIIEKEMFIRLPNIQAISSFLHDNNDFSFQDYNHLLSSNYSQERIPTGTCIPFSKKIFVTVNGKLLACERIGHQFELGRVDKDGVFIDFSKIAKNYNRWFDKLSKQCSVCYNADHCTQCIFNLKISDKDIHCNRFVNRKDYTHYLTKYFNYIENTPGIYPRIFKEVLLE